MKEQSAADKRREFYVSKAREAEAHALKVGDEEAKTVLIQIAIQWRILSERIRDYSI